MCVCVRMCVLCACAVALTVATLSGMFLRKKNVIPQNHGTYLSCNFLIHMVMRLIRGALTGYPDNVKPSNFTIKTVIP